MSALNHSGEEQTECPLCMEPLEVDDLQFFPCTCGYQICRFCWHRIRTDENGLCPACRKAYPEDPADFKPLTQEAVAKLKAEKRQKDQQRKQKITENRKHLANVRVVQKNLVFVVGLPMRLADPEMLKKHEYFGKFGKIHKVVINQSTAYAGSQGPSASAYVTYQKSDDALRAIQTVNNIAVDGRTVKTSLGTTKYCSHFMKNQPCPKPDCMYLHDLGDPEASFTKEEMQQGKHQEYEKKLHEQLLSSSLNRKPTQSPPTVPIPAQGQNKDAWPSLNPSHQNLDGESPSGSPPEPQMTNSKDSIQFNSVKLKTSEDNSITNPVDSPGRQQNGHHTQPPSNDPSSDMSEMNDNSYTGDGDIYRNLQSVSDILRNHREEHMYTNGHGIHQPNDVGFKFQNYKQDYDSSFNHKLNEYSSSSMQHGTLNDTNGKSILPLNLFEEDNNSFFTSNNFLKLNGDNSVPGNWHHLNGISNMSEVLAVTQSENWQNTLGFNHQPATEDSCTRDDDLGFDPFHETQKALAEMIEKEDLDRYQPKLAKHHNNRLNSCSKLLEGLRLGSTAPISRAPPPGFTTTPNHMNAFGLGVPRTGTPPITGSKILPFIHPIAFPPHSPSAWDWPSLDPAIVTSAQHCDLYPGNPPPGFSLRQTLDNL